MQIKATTLLAVLSMVCACESLDRDAVEPNDLGITEIEVRHDQLSSDRVLTVRGLDHGDVVATAVLRTGMVLYGADMPEQLWPGTELKVTAEDLTASFVSPDRVPHIIYEPLSPEVATFLGLRAVASAIDKEAGIRFAPPQAPGTELAYTAAACSGSRFPSNKGGAAHCCQDNANTYHVNAALQVVNRSTYAPVYPTIPVCRDSAGATGCTNNCTYGPCGSAIISLKGSNGHIFVPTSNPNVCGWDDGGPGGLGVDYSPEHFVSQSQWGSMTATCACTGCNADGTPQCAFFDDFNRTSGMGALWLIGGGGGYNTDGTYAVSTSNYPNNNYARALPNPALNTADYSVSARITVPTGASSVTGVIARSDGTNMYAASVSLDGYVALRRQNGATWTWVEQTGVDVLAGEEHTLKLVVTGSNPVRLQVWFDGLLKIFYEDSSASRVTGIGAGGMHTQSSGVKYNDINIDPITTPLSGAPVLPLVDDFNRTGASLTVSPAPPSSISGGWTVDDGSFSTDGSYAVAGASTYNFAVAVANLSTNDYSVQADIQVPNSSARGQVFGRADLSTDSSKQSYAARIGTGGIYLVRYDNWSATTLATYSTTLSTGTDYTVKLVATGSNPVHLEGWLNGVLRVSYDDSSANRHMTGDVGISTHSSSAGVKWNSFRADPVTVTTPWSLVQTVGATGSSVSMSSCTAGHLIVVAVETSSSGAVSSVTDNVGNTYVSAGARAISTTVGRGVELWYAKNSIAGTTTVTASASTVHAVVAWEVAGINTTSPLQTATKLDNQSGSTTPLGASITTTASGEFVVSVAIANNMITGIHSGNAFTNDVATFNDGWAHLTSNSAAAGTYQAQWDQSGAGAYCASSAAFFKAP